MKVHTETMGAGPDLVLLHGWGMNAGVWAPIAESLAAAHRLTLVDLPGHGASTYDSAQRSLSDWATAVQDAVPEGAAWIGWSLGAQVALNAAMASPEAVAALVLVAGTPRFVQGADWTNAMEEAVFRQFSESLITDHAATLQRFLALQVRGAEHAGETLRWLRQEVRERPSPQDAALETGLELLLTTDLRNDLKDLRPPTLWLLGERDTLVPVDTADSLRLLQPDAEVRVIPGAAHAPFLSHPAQALGLIDRFFGEFGLHG